MRSNEKQTACEMAALLQDCPHSSLVNIRDLKSFWKRFSNEGFGFLSKILPSLGKSFDKALSGNVAFSVFSTFRKVGNTCFPHFLGSALRTIFDDNGYVRDDACPLTIKWFRTFFYYAYKIEVPFPDHMKLQFEDAFKRNERYLSDLSTDNFSGDLINIARHVLSNLPTFKKGSLKPQHGPGVSSNCDRGSKQEQFVQASRLRAYFGREFFHQPYEKVDLELFLCFVFSFLYEVVGVTEVVRYCYHEPVANVLFVPKDSRGPRVICCEDSRSMWAQKAIQKQLYSAVEHSDYFGGHVNFTDQSINKLLTFDKTFATVDMKDASDLVSLNLVASIFPRDWVEAFIATRTRYAKLPVSGEILELEKFAPMGSALCFPVMALAIYSIALSAIYLNSGSVPNRNTDVYVYGDDLIIKNEFAEQVMEALESVGLKVNKDKSFVNSKFTESCGQDTFLTYDVSAIKRKRFLEPLARRRYKGKVVIDAGLEHSVCIADRAYKAGFINLFKAIDESIVAEYGNIPYGTERSSFICYTHLDDPECANVSLGYQTPRYVGDVRLQRDRGSHWKMRRYVVRDRVLKRRHEKGYGVMRDQLLSMNGRDPVNTRNEISARDTYLAIEIALNDQSYA